MKKIFQKNKNIIFFFLLLVIFFSFSITITWDSTHYMTYVNIFEGLSDFSTWDLVRGPVFPSILYIGFTVFGKTTQGALLLMFVFYLLYLCITKLFCDFVFGKRKIIKNIIMLFCVFNPIIFGYFHTLLTEFVAITIAILSCYIAYKWWNVENKKQRIGYSLYFILMVPITWFLKQPYVCCTLIPMFISTIIALFNNHKKEQIIYYAGTVILSCLLLIVSIVSWNKFLEYKGVNMATGRDSSSMVSMQLMQGVQYFKYNDDFDFDNIDENKYLTNDEKTFIKNKINKSRDNLRIINIYNHGKLIEQDVIEVDNNYIPSTKDVILQIGKTFIKHPNIIIKNYAKNYCALSSVCVITSEDGVMYNVTDNFDFINTFEDKLIAYKNFNDGDYNYFFFPEERLNLVSNFIQITDVGIFANIEKALEIPTNIIYKITILILPFVLLGIISVRIVNRKKVKKYELYVMALILLGYSFLAIIANALSGAIIDRYATSMFIPGFLGICAAVMFSIENFKYKGNRSMKKNEER